MRTFFHFVIFSLFLLLFINFTADSQIKTTTKKLKPPLLIIEVLGDYNFGVQDTKGEVKDFFDFKNYGGDIGFGGQINWKLAVSKNGSLRPYLTIGYAQFQNSDNSYAYIDSNHISGGYPLDSGQYHKITGMSDLYIRDAYAGLGIEYAFMNVDKRNRFMPYAGIDFDLGVLWGLYRQTPDTVRGGASKQEISFTIKPGVRYGFGLNLGAQYRIAEAFGLGLGIHYRWANLIGKKSLRTKNIKDDINDENKMELLDEGDTSLNSLLTDDRNIGFIELYFGFVFYIGKK